MPIIPLDQFDPETRAGIEAYRARKLAQEAELALVEDVKWERTITAPGQTRRARETVTVSRHPTGWRDNLGQDHTTICQSLFEVFGMDAAAYHEFHGLPEVRHPSIWRVSTSRRGHSSKRHYCEHHLPTEFRPQKAPADG